MESVAILVPLISTASTVILLPTDQSRSLSGLLVGWSVPCLLTSGLGGVFLVVVGCNSLHLRFLGLGRIPLVCRLRISLVGCLRSVFFLWERLMLFWFDFVVDSVGSKVLFSWLGLRRLGLFCLRLELR